MTEYEESPGVISMMRVGVAIALRAGVALIAASIATTAVILALKVQGLDGLALGLAAAGSGVIAGALGAKGWQAQAESRVRP